MTDQHSPCHGGKVDKSVPTRDGFKPSAPADLILPKPTRVPAPPQQNNEKK